MFVEKLFFSIKTSNMKYKEAYKHALLTNKVLNYPKDVNLKSSGWDPSTLRLSNDVG